MSLPLQPYSPTSKLLLRLLRTTYVKLVTLSLSADLIRRIEGLKSSLFTLMEANISLLLMSNTVSGGGLPVRPTISS